MKRTYLVWAVCAVAATALAAFGWRMQHRDGRSNEGALAAASAAVGEPTTVEIARVSALTLADDLTAVGAVRANEAVVLRPEVAGRIAALHFAEGQFVRRGQLLVQLDDSLERAEVLRAEAQLALAKSNLDRTIDLARQNFVSESARDQAASTFKAQDAARVVAVTRLSKLAIRAPFDGVLGVRQVAVGDYVKEGQDMVAIEDVATIKLDFRVPERYLAQLRVGQKFTALTDALPNQAFNATIDLIDPQVDPSGRSVLVRGRIGNAQGLLRPGQYARVRLVFAERASAPTVPEEAIVPGANASYVYRVVERAGQTIAQRVLVETGLRRDGRVEIRTGLAAGDAIVVAGQIKLHGDESPVHVVAAAADAARAEAKS